MIHLRVNGLYGWKYLIAHEDAETLFNFYLKLESDDWADPAHICQLYSIFGFI